MAKQDDKISLLAYFYFYEVYINGVSTKDVTGNRYNVIN